MAKFNCACCGQPTLEYEDFGEICPVCGWEDDGVQQDDPDFPGGANKLSLNQYKAEFEKRQKSA